MTYRSLVFATMTGCASTSPDWLDDCAGCTEDELCVSGGVIGDGCQVPPDECVIDDAEGECTVGFASEACLAVVCGEATSSASCYEEEGEQTPIHHLGCE